MEMPCGLIFWIVPESSLTGHYAEIVVENRHI
jgi:hypothetical protein